MFGAAYRIPQATFRLLVQLLRGPHGLCGGLSVTLFYAIIFPLSAFVACLVHSMR